MFCGSSYRLRMLARTINYLCLGDPKQSLEEAIQTGRYKHTKIAEINSCGVLHEILRKAEGLSYSEYIPSTTSTQHQDLMNLTYKSNLFDVVLTSDVLEHVPSAVTALKETYRVLKPGGVHIMSVPLLMDRKTQYRAQMSSNGTITHIKQPSYHGSGEDDYLVWAEFGYDFIDLCKEAGFKAHYVFRNGLNQEDIVGTVVAVKPGINNKLHTKIPVKDFEDKLADQWGDHKLSQLAHKMQLTTNHIMNLEQLVDSYKFDNEEKILHIKKLETRSLRHQVRRAINATNRLRGRQE